MNKNSLYFFTIMRYNRYSSKIFTITYSEMRVSGIAHLSSKANRKLSIDGSNFIS